MSAKREIVRIEHDLPPGSPETYVNYDDMAVPAGVATERGFISDLEDGEMVFIRDRSLVLFKQKYSRDAITFALLQSHTIPEQEDERNLGTLLRLNRGRGRSAINGYFLDFRNVDMTEIYFAQAEPGQLPLGLEQFDPTPPLGILYHDIRTGKIEDKFAPNAGPFESEMDKLKEFTDSHVYSIEHPVAAEGVNIAHSLHTLDGWKKYGRAALDPRKMAGGFFGAIQHITHPLK